MAIATLSSMYVYYLSIVCLPLSIMAICYWYGYLVA